MGAIKFSCLSDVLASIGLLSISKAREELNALMYSKKKKATTLWNKIMSCDFISGLQMLKVF